MTRSLLRGATKAALRSRKGWLRWRARRVIEPILQSGEPPRPAGDRSVFAELDRSFPVRDSYRYDPLSVWQRGTARASALIGTAGLAEPGAAVLEAGCGDGTTGYLLHCYGHRVVLTDLADWRDGRARRVPFVQADLCGGLPLRADYYDLVCSFNALEHVADPEAAFDELIRVCKPGGTVHLKFGPLYPSAWGLHAYKTIPIPWVQYLFPARDIEARLQEVGIRDLGTEREELQPLNQWHLAQFRRLWERSGCEVLDESTHEDLSNLWIIRRYPDAFSGRGLTFEDVVTKSVRVMLRRKAEV